MFLSSRGTRITARRVQQIIQRSLEQAGLAGQGFSTHKLRHTAATLLYQQGGVDIRVLQQMLGHVNLGTTEIYTHTSSQQLKEAAESSPLKDVALPVQKRKNDHVYPLWRKVSTGLRFAALRDGYTPKISPLLMANKIVNKTEPP